MQSLISTSATPYARDAFVPGHFTASGFVRSPDRSAVLLIEHRGLQRWLQPGGHVDPDDPGPLAAAMREIVEETGCADLAPFADGLFGIDVHAIPARHDEPPHRHYDLQFAFQALSGRLDPSDEVAAASLGRARRPFRLWGGPSHAQGRRATGEARLGHRGPGRLLTTFGPRPRLSASRLAAR